MENYIISNQTIAILKKKNKTIIFDVDKIRVINKNIQKILNENCNFYGSDLLGRKKSAEKILSVHYKIPIYLNENLIFLQFNAIRNIDCLFINSNKIIDYYIHNDNLIIKCVENYVFINNISLSSFEKMFINSLKLNNVLNYRKKINFV